MFNYMDKITTVLVSKKDKEKHIVASAKNGWQVERIDQHASNKSLLLITYKKQ